MKHFQDLGHRVIYVVGSFTALIGDPTGRSKTRPPLTREEIDRERRDLQDADLQDSRSGEDRGPVQQRVARAAGQLRLGAGWRHDTTSRRCSSAATSRSATKSAQPIAVHEFLYPLAQAYDSVFLKADVELGGTDQLFNLNVGRDIMPSYDLEPQIVMTTPLLEGLDGVEKMSKSLGNYVGVTESPAEMFGKLMSISDELMWRYYTLLTDLTPEQVAARKREPVEAGDAASQAGEDRSGEDHRHRFSRRRGGAARGGGVRAPVRQTRDSRGRARAADAARYDDRALAARVRLRAIGERRVAQSAARRGAYRRREVHAARERQSSGRRRSCSRSAGRSAGSSCSTRPM